MILSCACLGIGEILFVVVGIPAMLVINWIRG